MKQYATIRLSDLEIVKQAKSKAALEGITLLALVEKTLHRYLNGHVSDEVLKDMETIASNCGGGVDNDDRMAFQKIGRIAQGYMYKNQPK